MGEFTQNQIEIYQKSKVAMYRQTHPEAKDLAYEAIADMFVITPKELLDLKIEEVAKLRNELDETVRELKSDERELSSGETKGMALTELYRDIANSKLKIERLQPQLKGEVAILRKLIAENPNFGIADTHGR